MIGRGIKWFCVGSVALAVLIIAVVIIVAGTEAGTRFLVARAAVLLPDELQLGDVSGTLASSLKFNDVAWSDESADIEITQTELELGFRYLLRSVLRLEDIRVTGVTVRLKSAPEPAVSEPFSLSLPVIIDVANFEATDLKVLAEDSENAIQYIALDGRIQGESLTVRKLSVRANEVAASLDGQLELRPPYKARATVDWSFVAEGADPFSGSGTVSGNEKGYAVEHSLTAPYAIASSGSVRWADKLIFDIQNTWANLSIPLSENEVLLSESGRVDLVGSTEQFQFNLNANALLPRGIDATVVADGVGDAEHLQVAAIRLTSEQGRVALTGPIHVSAEGLEWQSELRIQDLELEPLVSGLDGILNLQGQSAGRVERWEAVNGRVNIGAMTGTLFGRPLTGAGSIHFADGKTTFKELTLEAGENRLALNGYWGEKMNLRADISAQRLDALVPESAGKLTGTVAVSGALDNPLVVAELIGEQLAYADIRVDTVTLTSGGTGPLQQSVDVKALGIDFADIQLDDVTIAVQGGLPAHSIGLAAGLAEKRFDMQIQAGYEADKWAGSIQSAEFRAGPDERWVAAVPANFVADTVTQSVALLCMDKGNETQICAEFAGNARDDTQSIKVAVESFPIGALLETLEPQLLANGEFFADLRLDRVRGDYNGLFAGRIDSLDIGLRQSPDEDDVSPPVAADRVTLGLQLGGDIQNNLMKLEAGVKVNGTQTATGKLSVADVRDANSDLRASVDAALEDIGFISWFWDQFDIRGGELGANLTVAGSVSNPLFTGRVQMAGAEMFIPATGVTYNDIQLNAIALDTTAINFDATAESAGSQLVVSGTTLADIDAGWPTTLTITGQNIEFLRYPEWSVFASPELALSANTKAAKLSGLIVIPRAKVVLDKVPETAQSPSPDTVVHVSDAAEIAEAYDYDFDLTLSLGDDVKLEGFGLDAYLAGSLDLTGGLKKQFRGNGELSLKKGKFDAYGQELDIDRGLIIFVGPLDNPLLDVRATRDIDTVSVGILVTGAVDQPQSTLFSNPNMSEASILSYLITGQPLPEAGDEDGDRISGAAIALGLSQANNVVSEVSSALGLDELSIEGGSTDGRILAGKRLSSKLYIRYAYGVFDSIGNLLLRYRLNDQFAIESKSGEEQSLDIVYSVDLD